RPCHNVSPPLMGHFVVRNQLGVVLLPGRAQSCALLGFGRQKGVRGNIEQTRPTLPEGSGYLRDAQVMKGKGAAEYFVKTDRGIDLFAQLFEGIGWTGSRGRRRCDRMSR